MDAARPTDYFHSLSEWGTQLVDNLFVNERITYLVLSIITVTSISIATTLIGLTFPSLIVILPIGGVTLAGTDLLIHTYIIYFSHARGTMSQTAMRVDFLFKHLVLNMLITGSLLMGAGFASLLFGIVSIALGTFLNGSITITFSLGVLLPLGKLLIEMSHEIHDNRSQHFMDALRNILLHTIYARRDGMLVALSHFMNDLLFYLEHLLSEQRAIQTLLQDLDPLGAFTEERLREFLDWAIPHATLQTLHYLLDRTETRIPLNIFLRTLTQTPDHVVREKITALLLDRIENAFAHPGVRLLDAIEQRHRERTHTLNKMGRDEVWRDRAINLAAVETITYRLSADLRLVDGAIARLRPLWEEDNIELNTLPLSLQEAFEKVRPLRERFRLLRQALTGPSFAQLEKYRNRLLPTRHEEEQSDPAWFVIATRGRFTITEFERIADQLNIPAHQSISRSEQVNRNMLRAGLRYEEDLVRAGILLQHVHQEPHEIRQRLTAYLQANQPLLFLDHERVASAIEHLATFMFTTIIPTALIGLVVASAPVTYALGFFAGLAIDWRPSETDATAEFGWSVQERSRSLFVHLFVTRLLLVAPPLGGFLCGVYFAGDIRHYSVTFFHNITALFTREEA